jgi:SAM-dependent methyltransferase
LNPPPPIRPKLIAAAAAFLMFQGELMAGKRLLPDFGGAAYVWCGAILFFQLLVVVSYYGSRRLSRASARSGNWVVRVLSLTSLLTLLPSLPHVRWLPSELQPLAALLPFAGAGLALFCVTPLLHDRQSDPADYAIYAWSNGGALAGLIVYPLVVEPLAGLALQNRVWAGGVLLIGILGMKNSAPPKTGPLATGLGRTRWQWWVLPAISSALLLATTNQLSYEASPGPLAWALPLALFLGGYAWAFSNNRRKSIGLIATIGLVALISTHFMIAPRSLLLAGLLLIGGGAAMLVCHAWLAASKDANNHGFYSASAIGGVAGSACMILLVPHIAGRPVEFSILVIGTLSIAGFLWGNRLVRPILATVAVVAAGTALAAENNGRSREIAHARTLYGCLRVTKSPDGDLYKLLNNATVHGAEDRRHPANGLTYYGPDSGIAVLFREKEAATNALNVGVIGLGTGTINHLLRPQDSITYYEINPKVEELARKYFTYLNPQTRVLIGDGRKLLEYQTAQNFDVLAVDAFSGDAIPAHLLTREAGMIYRRHLKAGGVLVIHITNAHVDLLPVVNGLALALGMRIEVHKTDTTTWVLLKPGPSAVQGKIIRWTDDRNSILPVLKPRASLSFASRPSC